MHNILTYIKSIVSALFKIEAQINTDSIKNVQSWNFHFQNTDIFQYHPAFHAKYSGLNSLNPDPEQHLSVTGTLFFGRRLWKGAIAYFNPEISGGSGFSKTTGIAGFPNGEVYRVSDVNPHIYVARLFVTQIFPLSNEYKYVKDDVNQLVQQEPSAYFAIHAGKFSVMDFFDDNQYSHDPRTQFYNWALMGNPAWDYPANTRGYTYGMVFEFVKPLWVLRLSAVMVPTVANGWVMDPDIKRSSAEALEFERQYTIGNRTGRIRLISYLNEARMGNYKDALIWGSNRGVAPEIDSVQSIGRTKYGFGMNIEQPLSKNSGVFIRAGWNDGHNETWVFTEIDNHISAGFMCNGASWNRGEDNIGIAQIVNGLSKDHKDYLEAGGYGFIIGDGALRYGLECITEIFYSFKFPKIGLWITPDYQLIINPAYNQDRGPVHALGLRVHFER